MDPTALIALAGVIVASIAIYIPSRQAIRRDRREEHKDRRDEQRQAIKDACAPLLTQISELKGTIVDKDTIIQAKDDRITQLLDERRRA